MGKREMREKVRLGSLKGKKHSENLIMGGIIILTWVLRMMHWRAWIGLVWFSIGTGGGFV
jgi:hypothetical protein